MVMLMKTGGLCRSYAQTHPLQYGPSPASALLGSELYEGDDLGLHVVMRMVTSSCYVHVVDGSHVQSRVVLIVTSSRRAMSHPGMVPGARGSRMVTDEHDDVDGGPRACRACRE